VSAAIALRAACARCDAAPATMQTPSSYGLDPVEAFAKHGVDLTKVDPMMFASLVRAVRAAMATPSEAADRRVLGAASILVDWNDIEVAS